MWMFASGPTGFLSTRLSRWMSVGAFLCALPWAGVSAQFPLAAEPGDYDYRIEDVFIEARDGVELHARVWMPLELDGPAPSILTLTPYTSDDGHRFGTFYASHGFVYVNADVRGRGESGGEFWPLENDGPDGADIVGWIIDQPWSDGQVGMRGGSYRGMTQWQTLKEFPEGLVTIVPTASVMPGWDYPNPSGIFLSYAARWLAFVGGETSQANLFGDDDYWSGKYMEMHSQHRPFEDLDDLSGLSPRVFERWIAHPTFDDYWQDMNPSSADYARMDLPILTITGHFDGDQPGAMKYYEGHMANASESGRNNHYLILGPWSHAGTRIPVPELGGFTFGQNSVLNMEAVHLAWFDWTMRGGPKPEFLQDRVAHYVMDAEEWRFSPSLEVVASGQREWFLSSGGPVSDVHSSGALLPGPSEAEGADQIIHDPRVTMSQAEVDARQTDEFYLAGGLAFDPAPKAVYHSDALPDPLIVSGYLKLELYVEMDVPDADLMAGVYEVRPDGTTVFLAISELRARHRNGVDRSEPMSPDVVEKLVFDRFYWFSRKLHEGSRIRLVVAPMNTPDRDKNYHSGGNTILETDADARTATILIHNGPDYPSRLVFPVEGGSGR
jgi:putative CocE/NonD family hydrolase